MSTERLQQLLRFRNEDPLDPFNLYALALEYEKNDKQMALQFFEELLDQHSDYLPTYYQAGKIYEAAGNTIRACEIYDKGIYLGKKQGKMKAVSELQNARNSCFEDD